MKIRRYTPKDKEAVINLLVLNTPTFFDVSEQEDFNGYLKEEIEDYFVVEENSEIIGAGGINYFLKENSARISWDLIHPKAQGKGIGRKLTVHRIQLLKSTPKIETISVRTTQLVYQFYKKVDFELVKIEKDYWAVGFDLYLMELKISRN